MKKSMNETHKQKTLGFVGWSFLALPIGGAILGAILGLTGLAEMEYKGAKPWEHAIMLAINFGGFGMILGLAIAGVAAFIRLFRTPQRSRNQH